MPDRTAETDGRAFSPRAREDSATGPEPGSAVQTAGLSKDYRHPWNLKITRGVTDLDLEVRRGEVFGLLGPNGAGKTTALKLLIGLLRPTRGRGWLLGMPIGTAASRRRLGFLPEQPYFYDYLSGLEYLEFAARLSGLPGHEAVARARHWLDRVGLSDRPRLVLRKYSKGMLQRLGLAAALIHSPQLLILDEPMSGLDPFGRRDVRELILEQRDRGVTVLFSSHILPDVEMLCDRVGILIGGRLVRTATVGQLMSEGRGRVEVRCLGAPLVEIPARWRSLLTRTELPEGSAFALEDGTRLNEVVEWLMSAGARLSAVTPQRASLEDFFLSVAQSTTQAAAGERRSA
jgi:ABC-2 type transport system ATP-binding protein